MQGHLSRRLLAVLAIFGLTLGLIPTTSASSAVINETVWLDTYEWHTPSGGGDGAAGPVFTSDVLKVGDQYEVTVEGTYTIWWDVWPSPAGAICGVPEEHPMFPSAIPDGTVFDGHVSNGNGTVGLDAAWLFATPDCGLIGGGSPPKRWPMMEFSMDGGNNWEYPWWPTNIGSGPNPDHKYKYVVTGQGAKLGIRLNDWYTVDNYGMLKVSVKALGVIGVDIDIKPGSYPNSINLSSNGTVPVAILSSAGFDATKVDPTSVMLAGASVALKGKGTPMASIEDVNKDGHPDLVVHVSTEALLVSEVDIQARLTGQTYDGTLIEGSDSVRVVPAS